MKKLGVLGGMGPQASMRFYERTIAISTEQFGADANHKFPHMLISNIPVPDLISSQEDEERTVAMVEEEALLLKNAGAELFAIPCNTMHLYIQRFRTATQSVFLSMIDEVVKHVVADGHQTVGVMGTQTTMRTDLYGAPLRLEGVEPILPTETQQERIVEVIRRYIAGLVTEQDQTDVNDVILSLAEKGAKAIVLGCTELPLAIDHARSPLPLYDSLQILAEAACREMYKEDR